MFYAHMVGRHTKDRPETLKFSISLFTAANPPLGYLIDESNGLLINTRKRIFIEIDEPYQQDVEVEEEVHMEMFCCLDRFSSISTDGMLSFIGKAIYLCSVEFQKQKDAAILASQDERQHQRIAAADSQGDDLPF